MANKEHLENLREGVVAWNQVRRTSFRPFAKRLGGAESMISNPEIVHFTGADLIVADLSDADLASVDLASVDLAAAKLSGTNFSNANLSDANLSDANLISADLSGANLSGADLRESNLRDANLRGANLIGANLRNTNLTDANLSDANLSGANLRAANRSAANLSDAKLRGPDLSDAKLSGANLSSAKLSGANLIKADLSGANLSGADLCGANLSDADLCGANLCDAKLIRVNLRGANLSGANLCGALLFNTIFADTDLSKASDLSTCRHLGSSSIDHRTLERSGKLPDVFLRGCGFSDTYIDYIPSIFGSDGIEFYSCFISHNSADKEFARRLHDALQGRGIRCWLDEKQIPVGGDFYEEIDRGIKHWDKIILCCSEASLAKSWWVDHELKKAMNKEQKLMNERGNKVLTLLPINLDGYVFSEDYDAGIKSEILSRKVGEFSKWKEHDAFEVALEELVQALRADGGVREPVPVSKL